MVWALMTWEPDEEEARLLDAAWEEGHAGRLAALARERQATAQQHTSTDDDKDNDNTR